MDEPTAALGVRESRGVVDLIRRINDQGLSIILISHNMPQVIDVTHRIMVLRHGQRAGVVRTADTDVEQVVRLITGAEVLDTTTTERLLRPLSCRRQVPLGHGYHQVDRRGQRRLVDVEARVVVAIGQAALLVPRPYKEETAGHGFQERGEVLRRPSRGSPGHDPLGADDVPRRLGHDLRHRRVVNHRLGCPTGSCSRTRRASSGQSQWRPPRSAWPGRGAALIEGADGARQCDRRRDDVGRRPGMERSRPSPPPARAGCTSRATRVMQRHRDVRGDEDGIDAEVRVGAMPARSRAPPARTYRSRPSWGRAGP